MPKVGSRSQGNDNCLLAVTFFLLFAHAFFGVTSATGPLGLLLPCLLILVLSQPRVRMTSCIPYIGSRGLIMGT